MLVDIAEHIIGSPLRHQIQVQSNPTKSKITNKNAGFTCFSVHANPKKSIANQPVLLVDLLVDCDMQRSLPTMKANRLTDIVIRQLKAADKLRKVSDGAGLYLEIAQTGGKLWRYAYRFDGKQKLLALGKYPDVSLQEARKRHAEARERLPVFLPLL
jgi:hypothetical protein